MPIAQGRLSLSTDGAKCAMDNFGGQFLARDSMLSALYAIARPSVRPSVHHTGGSVENG